MGGLTFLASRKQVSKESVVLQVLSVQPGLENRPLPEGYSVETKNRGNYGRDDPEIRKLEELFRDLSGEVSAMIFD